MNSTGCSQRPVTKRVSVVCLSPLVGLSGLSGVQAQSSKGHQMSDTRIVVNAQSHWEHWTRPEHVLDIASDGEVRPHAFRQVYSILEEDLETFRRSVEEPKIKGGDRAIMNVGRSPALARDGSLKLDGKKIGKYLDADFRRFPGNETHIVLGGQIYSITDTSMSGTTADPRVILALRHVDTGSTSTRTFATKDKVDVPTYDYSIRPGISRVGSNPDDAPNILDGDPATFWEPDLADTSDNWWVEVDLGRAMVVEKIVLRFVDEERGDPFRQFRVLVAPEQQLLDDDDKDIDFGLVGGTIAPNTEQRTFVLDAEDARFRQPGADPHWTGRMVETIRILVSDSKRFRARRISEEEWMALPPEDQGDIIYHIRDESGFEEPVEQSIYESFGPERQGRKDYYIRERPRLSEVEVWGWGDNLALGVLGRGGGVSLTGPYQAGAGFDGDWNSIFTFLTWYPTNPRGEMTVDLGALLWLDAVRLPASAGRVDGYIVRASDGTRDATGELTWRRVSPREREENRTDRFMHFADLYHPPLRIRYLHVRIVTNTPGGSRLRPFNSEPRIAELQFFSQGSVAAATMTSGIIRMPTPRIFGGIHWDPGPRELPEGTALEIRTRTGDLLVQNIRYLDSAGNEKTKEEWEGLFSKYRAPVDTTFTPGSGWSPWSRKYSQPGERVTSPSLRNFIQIQVKFTSDERWKAASIRSLEVELLDPVAQSLVGEVWPQEAIPGRMDTFEVYLRPTFIDAPAAALTAGFDEVLLSAPPGVDLRLLSTSTGSEEEYRRGRPHQTFEPVGDGGEFLDGAGDTLRVRRTGGDSLWVRYPTLMRSLPETIVPKVYTRVTPEGDEVPVGQDGEIISEAAYGLLPEAQRGRILFFRRTIDAQGTPVLEELLNRQAYAELPAEQKGPMRYFRKLVGGGANSPFNARGDSLTSREYNALSPAERGIIIGGGRLIRLRFASTVFLNGTVLKAFVRNSGQASEAGGVVWQRVDPGDATDLSPGEGLSIGVPIGGKVIDDVVISPNPFTPNGDGINDVLNVDFSVFNVTAARQARMRIYALDGRLVWQEFRPARGGRHTFHWTGVDRQGRAVPPGLYICQLHLRADWSKAEGVVVSRTVAVVY